MSLKKPEIKETKGTFIIPKLKSSYWGLDSKLKIWLKHPGFSVVSFFAAGPFSPLCLVISFYAVAVLIFDLFVQNDCPKIVKENWNFQPLRSKGSALRHDVLLNLSCGSCSLLTIVCEDFFPCFYHVYFHLNFNFHKDSSTWFTNCQIIKSGHNWRFGNFTLNCEWYHISYW